MSETSVPHYTASYSKDTCCALFCDVDKGGNHIPDEERVPYLCV